ncbi:MAG: TIGR02757 family protein [Bacteroidales bacterium]|nr:TIGR02757 family protein [Bacteroidales bacterium]
MLDIVSLKKYLDQLADQYERCEFVQSDPISIPHLFSRKEDIEIAAFFTATISWGQRNSIIKKGHELMQLLEYAPYDFIINASSKEWNRFSNFTYRTFNNIDCVYFFKALKSIYRSGKSLENIFTAGYCQNNSIKSSLSYFRNEFLSFNPPLRTFKHIANVEQGSAAKRLNMFLRWMVRPKEKGVDFGLWDNIPPSALMLPLDLHSSTSARKLGLLTRKNNDWKAVEEVTANLRKFDPVDPVKYDFALFGLNINKS